MAARFSERAGQRWPDDDRRFREREHGYGDRGYWERFADEVRSWFGDEEAQRRRMRDEREDGRRDNWRRSTWGPPDWSRGDWRRPEWDRGDRVRGDWRSGPDEREWSRDWGFVEGRGGYGSGGHINTASSGGAYGAGGYPGSYGIGSYGSSGYGYRGGGQHVGRGPRNYQRTDDRIREDLCERFTHHGDLDASDLDVRVQNGEVTLTGSVTDRWAKRTAEDIAEGVWGVKEVHNQIRITQGAERQDGRDDQGRTGPQRGTWAA